ncbi:DUF4439 domain-containing protein [Isoptericola variabilis]|uniref:DUF4439 domain-containing protein n=1 Tax=Isoptericola variabilis (strain 225) TaxID=743718 RepID=F6FRY3_ISOV2|nr:DUF4439 domain-containing protein [Isoptericola variabilis]AEG43984.1 hypothetical protein Isova_1215 [Isoptericola variabilis 225]
MEPHPAPARTGERHRRRAVAVVAAVVAAVLAGGCGVRLETPPPSEPVPDALEVVRRTAVADALVVAEQAEQLAAGAGDEALLAELERVGAAARLQAAELGGVYDSGLDDPTPSASPQVSETTEPVTPADLVRTLSDAAARSRSAASTTTDGPLARLLASVGASQTVSATRLAGMTDAEPPAHVAPEIPVPPEPGTDEADGSDDGAGASDTAGASPDPADASPGPEPSPSPDGTPEGLTADDLAALVAGEDAAGFALRQRAAMAEGEARGQLLARAEVHTARGEAWARFAGTHGTDQDPRRVAYVVPDREELDDTALARTLEEDLAVDYASLVATSAPGTRGVLVDLLVDAALAVDAWGGPPSAFPGLPEQAED